MHLFGRSSSTAAAAPATTAAGGRDSETEPTNRDADGLPSPSSGGTTNVFEDIARAFSSDPSPSSAPLIAAINHLRSALQNPKACKDMFEDLETLQRILFTEYSFGVALAASEYSMNRYADVLPYDHNRVLLSTAASSAALCADTTTRSTTTLRQSRNTSINSRDTLDGYINASLITMPPPRSPSTTAVVNKQRYIATQGPLPNTCAAFWRMVVEQGVTTIVMLTGIVEKRRLKCEQYFPSRAGTVAHFDGGITAETRGVDERCSGFVRRQLEISGVSLPRNHSTIGSTSGTTTNSHQPWRVQHLHMTDWPDHGVPSSPATVLELCGQIHEASSVVFSNIGEASNAAVPPPIVVHCSAGIGRSGVFIAIDTALRQLKAVAALTSSDEAVSAAVEAVDMTRVVAEMRHQRAGMVQTCNQFRFCYATLLGVTVNALAMVEQQQQQQQQQHDEQEQMNA